MDNLTHSLFGWTLARAGLGRGLPHAAAALVVASNAPDADIVVAVVGGGVEYLAAHRGPTHGPLGVLGLGLLVAGGVAAWTRWCRRGDAAPSVPAGAFVRWWALATIGILGHLLMDLPTAYGTRVLSPFVATWFALDWMPIIDVFLWAVLIVCLVVGRRTAHRRRAALVALALMAADYAGRALLHQRALAHGAVFDAAGTHAPCATAPTLVRHPVPHALPAGPDGCLTAAALPTFGTPFTWRIVRQSPGGYELSDRNLLDLAAPQRATRIAVEDGPEVARARATRAGTVYFDFARFPIARVDRHASPAEVRLYDARFIGLPTAEDLSDARGGLSFTVTLPDSP